MTMECFSEIPLHQNQEIPPKRLVVCGNFARKNISRNGRLGK